MDNKFYFTPCEMYISCPKRVKHYNKELKTNPCTKCKTKMEM